jgi:phosphoribosylformylglycinamidine synthase
MAIAGGLGVRASLRDVPCDDAATDDGVLLFSESPSRFLLEVRPDDFGAVAELFGLVPLGRLGEVESVDSEGVKGRVVVLGLEACAVIDASVQDLKSIWQRPLDW